MWIGHTFIFCHPATVLFFFCTKTHQWTVIYWWLQLDKTHPLDPAGTTEVQSEAGVMKGEGRKQSGPDTLFEDPDFPSEDTTLFCDSSTPIARLQGSITWLRPQVRPGVRCGKLRRRFMCCWKDCVTVWLVANSLASLVIHSAKEGNSRPWCIF